MRSLFIFELIFVLVLPSLTVPSENDETDIYQKGLSQMQEGHWQQALESWLEVRPQGIEQGYVDPKIAFAFIELTAQKAAREYYEDASEFYFWGISTQNWKTDRETLVGEIKRILPLLTDEESQRWEKLVEKNDPVVLRQLKKKWTELDPVQSTKLNERLLEHWQRIAHSRREFNKAGTSVYNTDDRGLIYVKYGQPDRSEVMTLGNNKSELMYWAPLADFNGSGLSLRRDRRNYQNLKAGMELYITYPECEVWLYSSLGTTEPAIFLFGPERGKGGFKWLSGVEDLIPSSAFSKSSSWATGGLVPGGLLQLIYYSKLAVVHPFFERRYQELNSRWGRALVSINRAISYGRSKRNQDAIRNSLRKELRGIRNEFRMKDEFVPTTKWARASSTDFDGIFNSVDLTAYMIRTLNDKNEPRIIFIAFEFPRIFRRSQSFKFPNYDFRHRLLVRDTDMNIVALYETEPRHRFTNTVVYDIAYDPSHTHYTVSLETFLTDTTVFPRPLSVGNRFFQAPASLQRNSQKLEISDLVLGIEIPESLQKVDLPFPVVPSHRILKTNILHVYLEIYHLSLDQNGQGQFVMDFSVIKLERKDDSFKRKEVISTSFDFGTISPTAKENLGLDISKLDEGDYELVVEVKDKVSSQRKRRAKKFQILARE